MKYICLGYLEPDKFETMSESERNPLLDDIFYYSDVLRNHGHLIGEEPLQSANTATTLRWNNGKVSVTDGPYLETKEHVGGFWLLEAADLDEALAWGRKAAVACRAPVEVRPFLGPDGSK